MTHFHNNNAFFVYCTYVTFSNKIKLNEIYYIDILIQIIYDKAEHANKTDTLESIQISRSFAI